MQALCKISMKLVKYISSVQWQRKPTDRLHSIFIGFWYSKGYEGNLSWPISAGAYVSRPLINKAVLLERSSTHQKQQRLCNTVHLIADYWCVEWTIKGFAFIIFTNLGFPHTWERRQAPFIVTALIALQGTNPARFACRNPLGVRPRTPTYHYVADSIRPKMDANLLFRLTPSRQEASLGAYAP